MSWIDIWRLLIMPISASMTFPQAHAVALAGSRIRPLAWDGSAGAHELGWFTFRPGLWRYTPDGGTARVPTAADFTVTEMSRNDWVTDDPLAVIPHDVLPFPQAVAEPVESPPLTLSMVALQTGCVARETYRYTTSRFYESFDLTLALAADEGLSAPWLVTVKSPSLFDPVAVGNAVIVWHGIIYSGGSALVHRVSVCSLAGGPGDSTISDMDTPAIAEVTVSRAGRQSIIQTINLPLIPDCGGGGGGGGGSSCPLGQHWDGMSCVPDVLVCEPGYHAVDGACEAEPPSCPPVEIIGASVDQSVTSGSDVTLSVEAASAGHALTYQWSHNGSPISGATAASLILNAITSLNAGGYEVLVANDCGASATASMTLTVV